MTVMGNATTKAVGDFDSIVGVSSASGYRHSVDCRCGRPTKGRVLWELDRVR